jgi:hypothetical protein
MCFKPQCACGAGGIKAKLTPPRRFVTVTMNFAMVSPAQRDRELVADFTAERPVLRKAQVRGGSGWSKTDLSTGEDGVSDLAFRLARSVVEALVASLFESGTPSA